MARSPKKTLANEIKREVRSKLHRRGGLLGMIAMAVLALIGFISPEFRDKAAQAIKPLIRNAPIYDNDPLPSSQRSPLQEGVYAVVHVVDGDTLDVMDEQENRYRIRLIGADTPETVKPNHPVEPFGPEASAFTKRVIQASGNRVRVAFDGDQVDRYGRNLAMIYLQLPGDELLLNELLIREGLAKATLQYRFSQGAKNRFRLAAEEAQSQRKGIWTLEQSGSAIATQNSQPGIRFR